MRKRMIVLAAGLITLAVSMSGCSWMHHDSMSGGASSSSSSSSSSM